MKYTLKGYLLPLVIFVKPVNSSPDDWLGVEQWLRVNMLEEGQLSLDSLEREAAGQLGLYLLRQPLRLYRLFWRHFCCQGAKWGGGGELNRKSVKQKNESCITL